MRTVFRDAGMEKVFDFVETDAIHTSELSNGALDANLKHQKAMLDKLLLVKAASRTDGDVAKSAHGCA